MKCLVLTAALFGAFGGGFATPVLANQWKVRDLAVDPALEQSKLTLVVAKTGIQVLRRANGAVLTTIAPGDVVSLWYDDKLVDGSLGRKWVQSVSDACAGSSCNDTNLLAPLVMLAAAGVGYLVTEPFSKRQHAVNIRYRDGDRVEWISFGISWADHFWLMQDLSKVTKLKWLNLPLQRTKLFWSLGDHGEEFESWSATGDVSVHAGEYDVLAWDDGKDKGVLMVFPKLEPTPHAVAVESVVIEQRGVARQPPEYCVDERGMRRLVRISINKKRLMLPVWDAACRRAREPGNCGAATWVRMNGRRGGFCQERGDPVVCATSIRLRASSPPRNSQNSRLDRKPFIPTL